MRGAFDASVRAHDAGDINCDTDALQPKSGDLSGSNRGVVEVRPDRGDGVVAGKSGRKFRKNPARSRTGAMRSASVTDVIAPSRAKTT